MGQCGGVEVMKSDESGVSFSSVRLDYRRLCVESGRPENYIAKSGAHKFMRSICYSLSLMTHVWCCRH